MPTENVTLSVEIHLTQGLCAAVHFAGGHVIGAHTKEVVQGGTVRLRSGVPDVASPEGRRSRSYETVTRRRYMASYGRSHGRSPSRDTDTSEGSHYGDRCRHRRQTIDAQTSEGRRSIKDTHSSPRFSWSPPHLGEFQDRVECEDRRERIATCLSSRSTSRERIERDVTRRHRYSKVQRDEIRNWEGEVQETESGVSGGGGGTLST